MSQFCIEDNCDYDGGAGGGGTSAGLSGAPDILFTVHTHDVSALSYGQSKADVRHQASDGEMALMDGTQTETQTHRHADREHVCERWCCETKQDAPVGL